MKLRHWLTNSELRAGSRVATEYDALSEDNGLFGTELLDVRFDVIRSTAWLLFDQRGYAEGNTAIIVASDVGRIEWSAPRSRKPYSSWEVIDSKTSIGDGAWSLTVFFFEGHLELEATRAEYHIGEIADMGEAPPDYTSDEDGTIRARTQNWESEFRPVASRYLDASRES